MMPRIARPRLHGLRILVARARLLRRWVVEHAFVLFVLGPIVVGGVLWAGERQLLALREPLGQLLRADAAPGPVGWGLAAVVLLALWTGTLREVYGRSRPGEDLLDALPVGEGSRFVAIAGSCLVRSLVPALLILGALAVLDDGPAAPGSWPVRAALVALAVATLAALDLLLVYVLAAVRWLTLPRLLAAAAVPLAGFLWTPLRPLLHLASRPLEAPAALLEGALRSALGVAMPVGVAGELPYALRVAAVELGALVVVAGVLSVLRRRHDLEHVQQVLRSRSGGLLSRWLRRPLPAPLEWRLEQRWDATLTAGLRRDLRLVARRFSPVVQLAAALALACEALAVALVVGGRIAAQWHGEVLVIGGVLTVLAWSSVVPFLLSHELPRFWIERSTSVEPERVWGAKALLAGLLAVAPLAVGVGTIVVLLPLGEAWLPALQLLAAGGSVAAVVGASVFEIAEEPHLGLLFAAFVGLALATLFVAYPKAWFLWLAGAGWVVGMMVDRGARRVRFTEVPR